MYEVGQSVNQNDGGHDDDVFYVMVYFVQHIGQKGAEYD